MNFIDWIVLFSYIAFIIYMGWYVGRKQKSREDYYLGGRKMPPWQIGLSIMATQVSAISLIGAPAFIALKTNGGLVWLQYEFAIPLAMMGIMFILVPVYHKTRAITIYEFLEKRFGENVRTIVSLIFMISRGLGTGVALLATGIVTAACLNWPLAETILLIGIVSIIYTTFGGIVADIYSDIIQLIILWGGSLLTIYILWDLLDGQAFSIPIKDIPRIKVFDFSSTGLGDGKTFAFWPMLIGGFFLYLSYYGCDQSQAQRLLTTETEKGAKKALLLNGLLRFPLVLTYSLIGVMLIPFLNANIDFASQLNGVEPDFLVPYFLVQYMPHGLLGLLIAGLFAASMSSIDSALNSLSASLYQDILIKKFPSLNTLKAGKQVRISRWLTIGWGIIATIFALQMIGGSETVLELVNKIGSAFYGPVLAVFWLGMISRRSGQSSVIGGLFVGVTINIILWQFFENSVSWLWWNVIGFIVTCSVSWVISFFKKISKKPENYESYLLHPKMILKTAEVKKYIFLLLAVFVLIVLIGYGIEVFLMGL
ncbi:MAG: sodium:solute symporter [Calditrichia bacterium]|nr:sodium:solute symporter [Calditrichia bacterium]